MKQKLYKAKDVMRITGLARGTLDSWLFKGLIVPTKKSVKRGHPSRYTLSDVVCVYLIDRLSMNGLDLKKASQIAGHLNVLLDDPDKDNHVLWVNMDMPPFYATLILPKDVYTPFVVLPEGEMPPEEWDKAFLIRPKRIIKEMEDKL